MTDLSIPVCNSNRLNVSDNLRNSNRLSISDSKYNSEKFSKPKHKQHFTDEFLKDKE